MHVIRICPGQRSPIFSVSPGRSRGSATPGARRTTGRQSRTESLQEVAHEVEPVLMSAVGPNSLDIPRVRCAWNSAPRFGVTDASRSAPATTIVTTHGFPRNHSSRKMLECSSRQQVLYLLLIRHRHPGRLLSLIHISEPTRQAEISYA